MAARLEKFVKKKKMTEVKCNKSTMRQELTKDRQTAISMHWFF